MATDRDHAEAARMATKAGEVLLALRASHPDPDARRAALRDAGDAGSQAYLAAQLTTGFPDDAVLSEEAVDDASRLDAARVWIIDPLDGTREFGEVPRTDWAVHVALWERRPSGDGELTAGAVALPAADITLSTAAPPSLPPAVDGPPRIVVSRSRPPQQAQELADALDGVLVPLGSAGAKAMAVVQGAADIYVHSGGQYEWDSAAPVAVAMAAGLICTRIDGSPLRYNRADPYLPDLLIARPELAEAALATLAG